MKKIHENNGKKLYKHLHSCILYANKISCYMLLDGYIIRHYHWHLLIKMSKMYETDDRKLGTFVFKEDFSTIVNSDSNLNYNYVTLGIPSRSYLS